MKLPVSSELRAPALKSGIQSGSWQKRRAGFAGLILRTAKMELVRQKNKNGYAIPGARFELLVQRQPTAHAPSRKHRNRSDRSKPTKKPRLDQSPTAGNYWQMKTIALSEARKIFYKLCDTIARSGEPCLITRYGKPFVRLIPAIENIPAKRRKRLAQS